MSVADKNLVIIDADSMIYLIASKYESLQVTALGISSLDDFIQDILINTNSRNYVGYFGAMNSKNFRYKVAKTKPYKGNRVIVKSDAFMFWEPILKERMEQYWKFIPVHDIEADDACSIAANEFRDKYDMITVATIDKDLLQIKDIWFYDYKKRTNFYCNDTIANRSLCIQLIMGDSSDNIAGCEGAGGVKAKEYYQKIPKIDIETLTTKFYVAKAKKFYIKWYTETLKDKLLKKLEKEYLIQYKKENDIKRFTGILKSNALKKFAPNLNGVIKTKEEAITIFNEMYLLIKLLDNKKEGKKYNFKLLNPILENKIDWSDVLVTDNDPLYLQDDNIDILDDL